MDTSVQHDMDDSADRYVAPSYQDLHLLIICTSADYRLI